MEGYEAIGISIFLQIGKIMKLVKMSLCIQLPTYCICGLSLAPGYFLTTLTPKSHKPFQDNENSIAPEMRIFRPLNTSSTLPELPLQFAGLFL